MSENSKSPSRPNSRNAYIVLSSICASNENIKDPDFNRNYLNVKPRINSKLNLSASAPNLNKCVEQGSTITQNASNTNINKNTVGPSSSRSSLSNCGETTSDTKDKPNPTSNAAISVDTAIKPKIQLGMDRYITVLKRGRSPKSAKISSAAKLVKDCNANAPPQNRFSLLQDEKDAPSKQTKPSKPPPIYLREKNSNELIKILISLIGEEAFYVTSIKRGNINETKIQVNNENDYRKTVSEFEKRKKNFYTYQLKSAKGLQVVIKGIDSCVDPEELKCSLENKGFKVKTVSNIRNRERAPQPLFRVELMPGDIKLKKNETHPIYDLKLVMHRRVTVEEPHKRSGPVQCSNCQEYGHTKTYCKLPTVCVVCGDLHDTHKCDKPKDDSSVKKCSNCGGNHTANYRGCPVFGEVKRLMHHKTVSLPAQPSKVPNLNYVPLAQTATSQVSYANVLKSNQPTAPKEVPANETTGSNFSRLESLIENMVQSVNQFMISMTSMIQEMQKMQGSLLQAILNRP